MECCAQNPVGSGAIAVDACKRVNYTLGMLLGVDDFVQEQTYHTARRHDLAREVLGYGTLRGLDVVIEPDGDKGPRLRVTDGMAWLPSGTPVCVEVDQCCYLNDWLATNASKVEQALAYASPPPDIVLHVLLSYAACLTDNVPIPGEPCRSEDELMKPSRVADGFRLELRIEAPPQREEDAIRDFVDWLAGIPVVDDSPPLEESEFTRQLREAAQAWLEPTSPPPDDFMFGSPPLALRVDEGLLRLALRLWVTELRPLWMARTGCGCGPQPPAGVDDALLLATLEVPLVTTTGGGAGGGGWRVSGVPGDAVRIDESRRPVLLSLRMVQELIGQHRTLEAGDSVQPATAFDLLPDPGIDAAYARADHSHGTPPLPAPGGDLGGASIDAAEVLMLQGVALTATGAIGGQGLLFDGSGWAPGDLPGSTLPAPGGDLSGTTIGNATVARLQGRDMSSDLPGDGDALRFDLAALTWRPGALPSAAGDFVGRTDGPYEIVAAGEVQVNLVTDPATGVSSSSPQVLRSYGGLKASDGGPGFDDRQTQVRLTAQLPDPVVFDHYVVKLTPILNDRLRTEFRLYLVTSVIQDGATIGFNVLLSADIPIAALTIEFRFLVEVSRFGRRAP